ncbi:hypothetical protein BDN72DRAFT_906494 [Pluteus cervinus]|uniref:Uncharacterized protein n=1 Tax=Pluteus cervinus TaxID=181527 RepID=A0ACD2ZZY0_9AGAR|nr:hypothetical protein BDN72DRAFT_906494 [Pluteus cervinus]
MSVMIKENHSPAPTRSRFPSVLSDGDELPPVGLVLGPSALPALARQTTYEGSLRNLSEWTRKCSDSSEVAPLISSCDRLMQSVIQQFFDLQKKDRELEDRLSPFSCAICLEILHEPATLDCGHMFCTHCLAKALHEQFPFLLDEFLAKRRRDPEEIDHNGVSWNGVSPFYFRTTGDLVSFLLNMSLTLEVCMKTLRQIVTYKCLLCKAKFAHVGEPSDKLRATLAVVRGGAAVDFDEMRLVDFDGLFVDPEYFELSLE